MAVVQRVVELPETFDEVGGAPVLRDQGRPLPVNSLAGVLGYEPGNERVGIVMAVPHPYILGVESVEGTADLVIKPLTAIHTAGITGTARSAEGELVLVVSLSFLLDGCRDWSARQWHKAALQLQCKRPDRHRSGRFACPGPLAGLKLVHILLAFHDLRNQLAVQGRCQQFDEGIDIAAQVGALLQGHARTLVPNRWPAGMARRPRSRSASKAMPAMMPTPMPSST
jgi:hypothetical protein